MLHAGKYDARSLQNFVVCISAVKSLKTLAYDQYFENIDDEFVLKANLKFFWY